MMLKVHPKQRLARVAIHRGLRDTMELNYRGCAKPMVRATYRLSLLCKTTMRFTAGIHHMVREYLLIQVGVLCPHVDDMLWRCARQYGEFEFTLFGYSSTCKLPNKPLDMGADEAKEDHIQNIPVHFVMTDLPDLCSWTRHTDDSQMWHYRHTSVTSLLENLRQDIDARVPGTGCGMRAYTEAPTTPRQWMFFVHRWVFGPSMPKQITLHRWLPPSVTPVGPRRVQRARPQPRNVEEADAQGQATLDTWLLPHAAPHMPGRLQQALPPPQNARPTAMRQTTLANAWRRP